jgi:hypothetical protein
MEALAAKGVWSDLEPDPGLAPHLRQVPERPDDPAPEQADAWVTLAERVTDPWIPSPHP